MVADKERAKQKRGGPLAGLRIIEFAGIGPGPFACMMLADHGADVIRIERPGGTQGGPFSPAKTDIMLRSRKSIEVDLKSDVGREVLFDLIKTADGVVEGFRPGVMERLGLGPDECHEVNQRLVYGRMTGWGQDGPLAKTAGHDINYIALSGALHAFGRKGEAPVPPINMVGDFGGGAMMLAFGMLAALFSARETGRGQVVDAAMTDGSSLLMAMVYTFLGQGSWRDERGVNMLDTGAHFYDVYETADTKHISLGPIEPQFYQVFLERVGMTEHPDLADPYKPANWDKARETLRKVFKTKTRDEWDQVFEGSDACYAPVLSLKEAPNHPHNQHRKSFLAIDGVLQPAPAPRYSDTKTDEPKMPDGKTATSEILAGLGYNDQRITDLLAGGSIA